MAEQLYLCIIICFFVVTGKSDEYCISSIHENLIVLSLAGIYILSNTTIYFMNGSHTFSGLKMFQTLPWWV